MDIVSRYKFLKEIGIDLENITDEIKDLYKQKLCISNNAKEHAKFMSERTLKEVFLLQVEEKESIMEFEKDEPFTNGLWTGHLRNKISVLMQFLYSL